MHHDPLRRRGIALILVLVVLAVVGTFLMAGFYAAQRGAVTDGLTLRVAQLDAANDLATADLLAGWDSAARFRQQEGSTDAVPLPNDAPRTVALAWLTRISRTLYLATIRSADIADASIFVRSARLLRVNAPQWPAVAALTAEGDVLADGSLRILPQDSATAPDCEPQPAWAPIAVPPGHSAPVAHVDWIPAAADSTYRVFGSVSLDTLAAHATLRLAAGGPLQAPSAPIVLAPGDLDLDGGSGRGLLIVWRRLRLSGPVAFRGVVIALGGLEVAGPGAVLDGVVLAGADSGPAVVVEANADLTLHYDRCVAADVAWHAGRLGPFRPRGWTPAP